MTGELDARQTVPLASSDRKRLRAAAVDLEVSPGLLARALVLAGLDRIKDPAVQKRIAAEAEAAHLRSVEAGREAMRIRYERERQQKETDDGTAHRKEDDDQRA